jgi:pimeloyl-ACP methyl ester carboxylesterase
LVTEELQLDRSGTAVPATLIKPDTGGPWPTWIVLHGITRPGRTHAQLVRFTRAVASTGCAVLIPEVPEWRELDLAPGLTGPTIRSAVDALRMREDIRDDRLGLFGFSFGAPQALAAAGDPEVGRHLNAVVGFGGYCELERTNVFHFTGKHEWKGKTYFTRPDPYGRWIVGANYLTAVSGCEDMDDVARALRQLAAKAGDLGVSSRDPQLDHDRETLSRTMAPRHREVFDLFVPPSALDPDPVRGEEMAHALSSAARLADPAVEPMPRLKKLRLPVRLLHGRHDRLIPFSESLRLQEALPPESSSRTTITPLFAHSSQDRFPGPWQGLKESMVFLRAMRGVLRLV